MKQEIQDTVMSSIMSEASNALMGGCLTTIACGQLADQHTGEDIAQSLLAAFFDVVGYKQFSVEGLSVQYNPEKDSYELNGRIRVKTK